MRATAEVVQSSEDLLEYVIDEARCSSALRGTPLFQVTVDLESRLKIVSKAKWQARLEDIIECVEECDSVEDKASYVKFEFSMLRDLCVSLQQELQRSLREAEFWRSGPLDAQATELRLLTALKPVTPILDQASLDRDRLCGVIDPIWPRTNPKKLTEPLFKFHGSLVKTSAFCFLVSSCSAVCLCKIEEVVLP